MLRFARIPKATDIFSVVLFYIYRDANFTFCFAKNGFRQRAPMRPDLLFKQLIKENKPAAIFLLTGMSVFAAAAIVATFNISLSSAAETGACIIGFAFILGLLLHIIDSRVLRGVLSWFVAILFMFWTSCIAVSAIRPGTFNLPKPACIVYFLADCPMLSDTIEKEKSKWAANQKLTPAAPAAPTVSGPPPAFPVFFQFYSEKSRPRIKIIMQELNSEGWKVQGTEKGGERKDNAKVVNEIRFNSPDPTKTAALENAATTLALRLKNTSTGPIKVVNNSSAERNALEVWIDIADGK
jgi:hypothetical protein